MLRTQILAAKRLNHCSSKLLVWCLDSPGFGGSEIDFLRVLNILQDEPFTHVVLHGNPLDARLDGELKRRGILTKSFKSGGPVWNAPAVWRSAQKHLREFRGAVWILWLHHSDSCRWLQQRLSFSRERYILAERMLPSSKEEFRRSRLSIPLKHRAVRNCETVAILARTQMPVYCKVFGVEHEMLSFIPNSRDVTRISARTKELRSDRLKLRKQLGLPKDSPVVICVGRLDDGKAQDILVKALSLEPLSSLNVHLCLLGVGPKQALLESLCSKLLPDRHTLAGNQPDPIPWLAAADVFAFPSRGEGLSGAIIEAMAAGVPCVVSDIPGNRELVHNGETGLLIPVNSSEELGQAIHQMLADSALTERCASAAYDLVAREYDEASEKAAWSKLIHGLAGNN